MARDFEQSYKFANCANSIYIYFQFTMQSIVSLIGEILTGKDTWLEWHRKVENTLIFNDLWYKICDGDTQPTEPTDVKEKEIWNYKNSKALALIRDSINGDIYRHIKGCKFAWEALDNLKNLFDSHSELEFI